MDYSNNKSDNMILGTKNSSISQLYNELNSTTSQLNGILLKKQRKLKLKNLFEMKNNLPSEYHKRSKSKLDKKRNSHFKNSNKHEITRLSNNKLFKVSV